MPEPSVSERRMKSLIGRAAKVYVACGGDPEKYGKAHQGEKEAMAVDEERLATLSPFGQEEYKLAIEMKNFRDSMNDERELCQQFVDKGEEPTKSPDVIRLRQQLRRAEPKLRQMQKQLNTQITSDEERERYKEMTHHIKSTLQRYTDMKQAGTVPDSTRDLIRNSKEGGGGNSNITNINDLDADGGGGGGGANYGSINPQEDEEFQQFFAQVNQKDQLMDQALDRIYNQTVSLRQNAELINAELKVQKKDLEEVETKVDQNTEQLRTLNKRLKATLKDVKQSSLCLYVTCFILLLALAGVIYFYSRKN